MLQSVLGRLTPFVLSQRVWNHVKETARRFDAAAAWKDPADQKPSGGVGLAAAGGAARPPG